MWPAERIGGGLKSRARTAGGGSPAQVVKRLTVFVEVAPSARTCSRATLDDVDQLELIAGEVMPQVG